MHIQRTPGVFIDYNNNIDSIFYVGIVKGITLEHPAEKLRAIFLGPHVIFATTKDRYIVHIIAEIIQDTFFVLFKTMEYSF